MSKISTSDIQHVAELAKIHIDDAESQELSNKLSDILDLVEKMQSINTENIAPMSHAIYQNQKLREDQSEDLNERDYVQKLSKETHDGFYLVPKVIE